MRLVPPDYLSEEEREIKQFLEKHLLLKARITLLLNCYREHCLRSFEAMQQGETDTADGQKSLGKIDMEALRLGFPLAETMTDWMELIDMLRLTREWKEGAS